MNLKLMTIRKLVLFFKGKILAVVLLGGIFSVSCQVSETIVYAHEASEEFYKSHDIDLPDLTNFIVDGVLLVLDVREVKHGKYIAWLGMYSKEEKRIFLESYKVGGLDVEKVIDIGELVIVNNASKTEHLVKASYKLFESDESELSKASADGKLLITVKVRLSGQYLSDFKEIKFEVNRKVVKRTVYPT